MNRSIENKLKREFSGKEVFSPAVDLIKYPFLRMKIIRAENIYLSFESGKREKCDSHAEISYGTLTVAKTEISPQTCDPEWDEEFEIKLDEKYDNSFLLLSIFDNDMYSSPQIVSNQVISLEHFFHPNRVGKVCEFWLKMKTKSELKNFKKKLVMESTDNPNFIRDLVLESEDFTFDNLIISEEERSNFAEIPIVKLSVQLFDHASLWNINANITSIIEDNKNAAVPIFFYSIQIKRNDGLEWDIERRYSEFRALYKDLKKKNAKVRDIKFPPKTYSKMFAYFSQAYENEYRAVANQRKEMLSQFLEELLNCREIYKESSFISFFEAAV